MGVTKATRDPLVGALIKFQGRLSFCSIVLATITSHDDNPPTMFWDCGKLDDAPDDNDA